MLPRRNLLSFSAVLSLSVAFILTGCGDKAPPQPGPVEVGIYAAVTQPITLSTVLAGRTSAYAVAEVRPQVGGIILKRSFTEGSDVRAGQPLYQIDPTTYRVNYERAKAALAKAEAHAVAERSRAERYKALVAVQAVSQQDYDDAVAEMKQTAAEILAAKASVETARIDLVYTQVNSPINGRIGRSSVTQGALVAAGQEKAMATIQQLDPIYVDVPQSSTEYLRLRQELASGRLQQAGASAAKVTLTMEDGSAYPLAGTLQLVDINVDPSTSAVTLRAIFPNPQGLLLPGVFVRAKLVEGMNDTAILLPQQGVMRDQKGDPYAFIVGKDQKVAMRQLTVGKAIGNRWVVLSGIDAGDKVIVEGIQTVKPGMVVKTVIAKVTDTSGAVVANKAISQPATTSQPGVASPAKTKK